MLLTSFKTKIIKIKANESTQTDNILIIFYTYFLLGKNIIDRLKFEFFIIVIFTAELKLIIHNRFS